ncbi:hypothetical protein GCM10027062_43850 [Nocardioides hungaricus]
MIDRATGKATRSTGTATRSATSTSSRRAQELRTELGVRREADELLAEASQARQRAAAEADALIAQAEAVSEDLVAEARAEAEQLVRQAQERADGIVGQAQAEADRIRGGSTGALNEAERRLGDLVPMLSQAAAAVAEVRDAVVATRGAGSTQATIAVLEHLPQGPQDVGVVAEDGSDGEDRDGRANGVPAAASGDDPRPLGWLFRSAQG